mmetsp:Transcript_43084/g.123214  ORF Transcript_43084/g.123214 Transcript_43084/m.123214 type:complete len:280 (+) Transcript_43084:1024-1863(+)
MQGEVLPELLDVPQHHQLLPLPVRQQRLRHASDHAQASRHVSHIEPEDAATVVVAHDLVDIAQSAHRHLRQTQALQIHDDREIFDTPRHEHVPRHVFHAKHEKPDKSVDTLLLIPLRGYPGATDHERGPELHVPARKVHDAVPEVLEQADVFDRAILEVVLAPLLRSLHALQSLLDVHSRMAEESSRHGGHRGEELQALRICLPLKCHQLLLLRSLELDVAVDLSLAVAVVERRNHQGGRRLEHDDLARKRERRNILILAGQRLQLRHRLEAIRTRRPA